MKSGFSLLEIMITIVLLTVGVTVILQVFSMSVFVDSHIEKSTIALTLAQESLEEIKDASSYSDIDNYAVVRTNLGGEFADFDREVLVSGDPKSVAVNVYWFDKGDEQSINLASLISDYDF